VEFEMRTINLRTSAGLIALAALAVAAGSSEAATITGLFNTGTDTSNVALVGGDGLVDSHYSILSSTSAGFAGGQAVTYFNTSYVANDADSRWISISADGNPGHNTTVYRTTFNLSGFNAGTAQLTGLWASDNNASILLNGAATGWTLPANGTSFFFLHQFTISSGFVAGVNHLDFEVTDVGPPTALRVDSIAGTAALAPPSTPGVPEASTWALMILGFGAAGAMLRRRRPPTGLREGARA
jgi:hypothetical protein